MTADAAASPPAAHTATARAGWRLRAAYGLYRLATRLHWAEPELNGLSALVRPGDVVVDVGAALGMYTIPLAHLVGRTGLVYSFEPQRRGAATVLGLRLLTGARRGTTTRSALGPTAGPSTIVVPVYNVFPIFGHAHIAEGAADDGVRVTREGAPMQTLDAWCAAHDVEGVRFLKVDVEGFEPSVIAGAVETIGRDLPSLLLEIEDRHLARYGTDAATFVGDIRARWPRYGLYTWDGATWTPTPEVTTATRNYLFATPEAFDRA